MTSLLPGTTADLIGDNLTALKLLFPEAFREDTIDFDMLKMLLSDYITTDKESYNFTRGGKRDALKLALAQTTGTLRPDRASSKDRDTTENLYIEGDNLEVLRVLQESYRGAVKVIYIDPPYNTGKDFVYKDDFHDNVASYKEKMGENMKSNPETNGRYHTDWLNMMYPRLKLARNLLRDDGVIFMSIGDDEVHNLKKIADEVFGEENFIAQFIRNSSTGGGIRGKYVNVNHEYSICYCKSISNLPMFFAPLSEEAIKQYNKSDEKGIYREKDFAWKTESTNQNQKYMIKCPDGSFVKPAENYSFRFIEETFNESLKNGDVVFKETKTSPLLDENNKQAKWNIYIKKYLGEGEGAPTTLVPKSLVGISNVGTDECKKLFEGKSLFNNPKSTPYLKYYLSIGSDSNDIILDFFSGSATTAHAVMALNAEDLSADKAGGGNRKYIMVQIPETTDESSEAYKAGYKTICEIGQERIRRAGAKIKEENKDKEGIDKLDIGFKCFTLDTTNLKKRDINPANINESLFNHANPIIEGRSTEDMLYEIMLKKGLELTTPVELQTISDKTVYIVGGGALIVCLDTGITLDLIHRMIALEPELMRSNTRSTIVLYDAGFATDTDKTNAVHQIEHAGLGLLVI